MANDPELARYSAQMGEAQRDIDRAKDRLQRAKQDRDALRSTLDGVRARIDDLKRSVANEREAARYCSQNHDRISAQNHRYNADGFKRALDDQYAIKNSYAEQMSRYRAEVDAARAELDAAKARKQQAREAFQARLAQLRAQKAERDAKWREKPCAICGQALRYNVDWTHIPNVHRECRERAAAERAARSARA